MPEKCPYCGGTFENTKALGSHIHYMHEAIHVKETRSEEEQETFRNLLGNCLKDIGLRKPRSVEKIEQAIIEIPEGIDADLDRYRDAYKCAMRKEKILNDFKDNVIRNAFNEDAE